MTSFDAFLNLLNENHIPFERYAGLTPNVWLDNDRIGCFYTEGHGLELNITGLSPEEALKLFVFSLRSPFTPLVREDVYEGACEDRDNIIDLFRATTRQLMQVFWFGTHASNGLTKEGCRYLYQKLEEELDDIETANRMFRASETKEENSNG